MSSWCVMLTDTSTNRQTDRQRDSETDRDRETVAVTADHCDCNCSISQPCLTCYISLLFPPCKKGLAPNARRPGLGYYGLSLRLRLRLMVVSLGADPPYLRHDRVSTQDTGGRWQKREATRYVVVLTIRFK